jgi:hypothetical protein
MPSEKNQQKSVNLVEDKTVITQAEYAKKLRPLLPAEAFAPDPSKLVILLINLAILILGGRSRLIWIVGLHIFYGCIYP